MIVYTIINKVSKRPMYIISKGGGGGGGHIYNEMEIEKGVVIHLDSDYYNNNKFKNTQPPASEGQCHCHHHKMYFKINYRLC